MTYRKLAVLAGVSLATVSKALSGSKEISEQTKERIIALAVEHGVMRANYHRQLEKKRVAIIVPEIISVYYSRSAQAVSDFLVKEGVEPSIHYYDFDSERYFEIINHLASQKLVDGILTFSEGNTTRFLGVPTVTFTNEKDGEVDCVYADLNKGVLKAVEHLYNLGHREIGFVGEKGKNQSKFKMLESAMAHFNLAVKPENVFYSNKRFEEIGYEAVDYFAKTKRLPTAILAGYDEIALGAIHAFKERGISVPKDLSIVGVNDVPASSFASTPLTTINNFNNEIFRLGVKTLLDIINNPKSHLTLKTSIKCELVIRQTTSVPRKNQEVIFK